MKIIGFVCRDGALCAAEQAASKEISYSSSVTLVELPCTGRVDIVHILRAFREGADAVFVTGCLEGNCWRWSPRSRSSSSAPPGR